VTPCQHWLMQIANAGARPPAPRSTREELRKRRRATCGGVAVARYGTPAARAARRWRHCGAGSPPTITPVTN